MVDHGMMAAVQSSAACASILNSFICAVDYCEGNQRDLADRRSCVESKHSFTAKRTIR